MAEGLGEKGKLSMGRVCVTEAVIVGRLSRGRALAGAAPSFRTVRAGTLLENTLAALLHRTGSTAVRSAVELQMLA